MKEKNEVVEVKTVKSFEKCLVLGKELTMYGSLEEPLFLAKDVAEWIEYSKLPNGTPNTSMMLKTVDEDEKVKCDINNLYTTSETSSKARDTQEMWLLTENGLYEVLMQSRKPIAKQFKKEVKRILKELRLKGEAKIEPIQQKSQQELNNETRTLMNEKLRLEVELARIETDKIRADVDKERTPLNRAMYWKHLADEVKGIDNYKYDLYIAYSTMEMAGKFILPLPTQEPVKQIEEPMEYRSATEVAKLLHTSAAKVGFIANRLEIKTSEYGREVMRTLKNGSTVPTFLYNRKAIHLIKDELKKNELF